MPSSCSLLSTHASDDVSIPAASPATALMLLLLIHGCQCESHSAPQRFSIAFEQKKQLQTCSACRLLSARALSCAYLQGVA